MKQRVERGRHLAALLAYLILSGLVFARLVLARNSSLIPPGRMAA